MVVVVVVDKSAYLARNAARDAHSKPKCISSPKAPALQNVQCLLALTTPNAELETVLTRVGQVPSFFVVYPLQSPI